MSRPQGMDGVRIVPFLLWPRCIGAAPVVRLSALAADGFTGVLLGGANRPRCGRSLPVDSYGTCRPVVTIDAVVFDLELWR